MSAGPELPVRHVRQEPTLWHEYAYWWCPKCMVNCGQFNRLFDGHFVPRCECCTAIEQPWQEK